MQLRVGREVFELKIVQGAIPADGTTAAIEVDYTRREFHISSLVPLSYRPAVVAAAVDTVWRRKTVPVVWPDWE